jgi:hypothetical protein
MRHMADYGADLEDDGAGAATVTFPPPPGATIGSGGPQIARSFLDDAVGAASRMAGAVQPFLPAAAGHPAAQEQAPPAAPPPRTGDGPDMQEIYEAVVDQLRRDILAERERMGDLLGDLLK